jgi:hypothetical protein
MFALGILSHRSDINLHLVYGALAVATKVASTLSIQPDDRLLPMDQSINLTLGHDLQFHEIQDIVEQCCIPFETSPQAMVLDSEMSQSNTYSFWHRAYETALEKQCQSLAQYLFRQWPTSAPQVPDTGTESNDYSLIEASFERSIVGLFSSRFPNHLLYSHTTQLQRALYVTHNREDQIMLPYCPDPPVIITLKLLPRYAHVTLSDLVFDNSRPAPVPGHREIHHGRNFFESESKTKNNFTASSTRSLISRLPVKGTGFLSRYTHDLQQCMLSLETRTSLDDGHPHHLYAPQITIENIQHSLQPQNNREKMLYVAGLWPSLGPESLLGQLSLRLRKALHPDWQSALVRYAEGITLDQRKRRITVLQRLGLEAERIKEAANHGEEG